MALGKRIAVTLSVTGTTLNGVTNIEFTTFNHDNAFTISVVSDAITKINAAYPGTIV